MYLTAMLVRNPVRDWEGVNVLLYDEPGLMDPLEQPPTTRILIAALDDYARRTRTLRGSSVVVPRGGNAVDAYIDVVVAGELPIGALDFIERRTQDELARPEAAETVAWTEQGVLVRAYVRPDKSPAETLQLLMRAARALVANPRREQLPITIRQLREEDRIVFELDEASVERLRALHGAEWKAPRVGISDDVRDAFETLHGDLYTFLVSIMTGGIDGPHLARLGGVEFVDEQGIRHPAVAPRTT